MSFVKVQAAELPDVCALFQAVAADMQARGLRQWVWGRYPREDILAEDVALERLYWLVEEGERAAAFAVQQGQDPMYEDIPWRYGVRPACLHRVAVRPGLSGRGYAGRIVAFAKQEGLRLGCDCFRVDTYACNARALKAFAAVTEREAGTFSLPHYDDLYHCFESPLTQDCPLLPMAMRPAYRFGGETPWGGDALRRLYGKAIPDGRTGEALEISCIPGLESRDADGTPLNTLVERFGARLTGPGLDKPFPLLLKLLAARENLSVQVHPNDAYALKHEGKLGKTEAWVILEAKPGACLRYGVRAGVTLAALRETLLGGGDVEPLIATAEVKAGDVLFMPSGMVHAIGGGITLYEIQQASDVTYRLWDYGRVNEKGETRPLHIEKSLAVIDPALTGQRAKLPPAKEAGVHTVLSVPAFTLACACAQGETALPPNPASFRMLTALSALTLRWDGGALPVQAGESVLIPASAPPLRLLGHGRALLASVPRA